MKNKKLKAFTSKLFGVFIDNYKELHEWLVENKKDDDRVRIMIDVVKCFIRYRASASLYRDGSLTVNAYTQERHWDEQSQIFLEELGIKVRDVSVGSVGGIITFTASIPDISSEFEVEHDFEDLPGLIRYLMGLTVLWTSEGDQVVEGFLNWFVTGGSITAGEYDTGYDVTENDGSLPFSEKEGYVFDSDEDEMYLVEDVPVNERQVEIKIQNILDGSGEGTFKTPVRWESNPYLNSYRKGLLELFKSVGAYVNISTEHNLFKLDEYDYSGNAYCGGEVMQVHTVKEIYKPGFE